MSPRAKAAAPGIDRGVLGVGLFAAVLALDGLWALTGISPASLSYASVDLPAHLATCLLLLLALAAATRSSIGTAFLAGAALATVAIDIDHIPKYLGWDGLGLQRPVTHSLLLVVVLLGLCGLLRRGRRRELLLGTAFGVSAHLLRDLATGPGVPLVWPLQTGSVSIPYPAFAALLALAAGVLVAERLLRSHPAGDPAAA